MNELQIFNNSEFGEIRTVTINDEPWFVAKDVCEALKHTNPTVAMQMLEDDERTKLSLGRAGEVNAINESGLYALIIKSNLPNAKKFRKWVTGEVLPAIRKTGSYGVPKTPSEQIQLIAKGYVELEQSVKTIKDDVADLKDNMPLYGCEIDEVCNRVKRKAVNVLGGKDSGAYRDSSIRGKVFSDIYTQIKREYGLVSSYKSIKRKYLADVHNFIDCYQPPRVIEEMILDANTQLSI